MFWSVCLCDTADALQSVSLFPKELQPELRRTQILKASKTHMV